jgi:DNA-binding transcriptional ArsR family regulator
MQGTIRANEMRVIAHIGNIPVEEWLPFLVPVVALYLYGRGKERRRHADLQRLPGAGTPLDAGTVELVMTRWSNAKHENLSAAYLPLLYPPGPDGMDAGELSERIHADPARVEHLLEKLEDLGYLDLTEHDGFDGRRAWLTFEGYDLLHVTEAALLAAASQRSSHEDDTQ